MIPDYRKFVIAILIADNNRFSANNILVHAFMLFNEKDFNETILANIDYCTPDTIGEHFHKQFRQIDMTDSGELDMIIWHAMHENTNVHKIISYIAEHNDDFEIKNIDAVIDDYKYR